MKSVYKQVDENSVLFATVDNEGSCESVHMRRFVRAFAACIHELWMSVKISDKDNFAILSQTQLNIHTSIFRTKYPLLSN